MWAFRGYDLEAGYPKSISTLGLPATVRRVDAAFWNEEPARMMIFVGRMLYR